MLNPEADAPYDILGGSLKGVVKPIIRGVMESSKRLTNEEGDERFVLMQGVHAAEVACQEKIEQIEKCRVLHRKVSVASGGFFITWNSFMGPFCLFLGPLTRHNGTCVFRKLLCKPMANT